MEGQLKDHETMVSTDIPRSSTSKRRGGDELQPMPTPHLPPILLAQQEKLHEETPSAVESHRNASEEERECRGSWCLQTLQSGSENGTVTAKER